jgi:hypothetical protein
MTPVDIELTLFILNSSTLTASYTKLECNARSVVSPVQVNMISTVNDDAVKVNIEVSCRVMSD